MIRVIGIGAGGHAKVVIDILRRMGGFEIAGLLAVEDSATRHKVDDVPILGDDSLLPALFQQGIGRAFIGVGGAESTARRRALYDLVTRHGFECVSAVHPHAVIA